MSRSQFQESSTFEEYNSVNESIDTLRGLSSNALFSDEPAVSSEATSAAITDKFLKLFISSSQRERTKHKRDRKTQDVCDVLLHVLDKLDRNVRDVIQCDQKTENPLLPILKKCFGIEGPRFYRNSNPGTLLIFITSLLSEGTALLKAAINKQAVAAEHNETTFGNRKRPAKILLQKVISEVHEELQRSEILSLTFGTELHTPSLKLIYYLMKTFILSATSRLHFKSKSLNREFQSSFHNSHSSIKIADHKLDEFTDRLDRLWEKCGGSLSHKSGHKQLNIVRQNDEKLPVIDEHQSFHYVSSWQNKENLLNRVTQRSSLSRSFGDFKIPCSDRRCQISSEAVCISMNGVNKYCSSERRYLNELHECSRMETSLTLSSGIDNTCQNPFQRILNSFILQPVYENSEEFSSANHNQETETPKAETQLSNGQPEKEKVSEASSLGSPQKQLSDKQNKKSKPQQAKNAKNKKKSTSKENESPPKESSVGKNSDASEAGVTKQSSKKNSKKVSRGTVSVDRSNDSPTKTRPSNGRKNSALNKSHRPNGSNEEANKSPEPQNATKAKDLRQTPPEALKESNNKTNKSAPVKQRKSGDRSESDRTPSPKNQDHLTTLSPRTTTSGGDHETGNKPLVPNGDNHSLVKRSAMVSKELPEGHRKQNADNTTTIITSCGCKEHDSNDPNRPIYQFFVNPVPIQCPCQRAFDELDKTSNEEPPEDCTEMLSESTEISEAEPRVRALSMARQPLQEPMLMEEDMSCCQPGEPSRLQLVTNESEASETCLSTQDVGTQTGGNGQCTCSDKKEAVFLEFDDKYSRVVEEIKALIIQGQIPVRHEPERRGNESPKKEVRYEEPPCRRQLVSEEIRAKSDPELKELRSIYESQNPKAFTCCKCCKCEANNTCCHTDHTNCDASPERGSQQPVHTALIHHEPLMTADHPTTIKKNGSPREVVYQPAPSKKENEGTGKTRVAAKKNSQPKGELQSEEMLRSLLKGAPQRPSSGEKKVGAASKPEVEYESQYHQPPSKLPTNVDQEETPRPVARPEFEALQQTSSDNDFPPPSRTAPNDPNSRSKGSPSVFTPSIKERSAEFENTERKSSKYGAAEEGSGPKQASSPNEVHQKSHTTKGGNNTKRDFSPGANDQGYFQLPQNETRSDSLKRNIELEQDLRTKQPGHRRSNTGRNSPTHSAEEINEPVYAKPNRRRSVAFPGDEGESSKAESIRKNGNPEASKIRKDKVETDKSGQGRSEECDSKVVEDKRGSSNEPSDILCDSDVNDAAPSKVRSGDTVDSNTSDWCSAPGDDSTLAVAKGDSSNSSIDKYMSSSSTIEDCQTILDEVPCTFYSNTDSSYSSFKEYQTILNEKPCSFPSDVKSSSSMTSECQEEVNGKDKPCHIYSATKSTVSSQPSETELIVMIIESHTPASNLTNRQDDIVSLILSQNSTFEKDDGYGKENVKFHRSNSSHHNSLQRRNMVQPTNYPQLSHSDRRSKKVTPSHAACTFKTRKANKEMEDAPAKASQLKQWAVKDLGSDKGIQVAKWNVKVQTAGPRKFNRVDIPREVEDKMASHLGLVRSKRV